MPNPGLHPRVPFGDYLAWPYLSNSGLSALKRSPAYFRWLQENPSSSTPAQEFGAAVHCAVLEPDLFDYRYVVPPKVDRRTKRGKEEWAEFAASHEDREFLSQPDLDKCRAIRDVVHDHPVAGPLLREALHREVSLVWTLGDVQCKGRADAVLPGHLLDLKITRDAHPEKFGRFMARYGTHRQVSWYMAGLNKLDHQMLGCYVVAVEPLPPHEVVVYKPDADALRAGKVENDDLLGIFWDCTLSGDWPGYADSVQEAQLPEWYLRDVFPEEALELTSGGDVIEF